MAHTRSLSVVNVHEEENDPALQISLDVVDDDLLSNIDYLDVGEAWILNWLVKLLVACDTCVKVFDCFLGVPSNILDLPNIATVRQRSKQESKMAPKAHIWTGYLDAANVCLNNGTICANALYICSSTKSSVRTHSSTTASIFPVVFYEPIQ